MDWHVVAGTFACIAFFAAFGFGGLALELEGKKAALAAVCAVLCLLSVPFLLGYVATGGAS